MLKELGDGYGPALMEHRHIPRSVFARHEGVEVDTQGDAFFVVFPKASEAVAAAAEFQEAQPRRPRAPERHRARSQRFPSRIMPS